MISTRMMTLVFKRSSYRMVNTMLSSTVKFLVTVAILVSLSTTPAYSQQTPPQTRWDLSQDIESGIPNNPYLPDNSSSVWTFLENKTTTLLPLLANTYTNLPRFNNPCDGLPTTPSNLQCWQNLTTTHPSIGVASSDVVFSNGSSEFTIPRSNLFVHPGNKNQVIVGWESCHYLSRLSQAISPN